MVQQKSRLLAKVGIQSRPVPSKTPQHHSEGVNMLWNASAIKGYAIQASAGQIDPAITVDEPFNDRFHRYFGLTHLDGEISKVRVSAQATSSR
jgi:hypothetical protein